MITIDEILAKMDTYRRKEDERETSITQSADNRDEWRVFSSDPVMIRRLLKIGATYIDHSEYGAAFDLHRSQLSLRQKYVPSKKQREVARANAKRLIEYAKNRNSSMGETDAD